MNTNTDTNTNTDALVINKAAIQPIPSDRYMITTSDVQKYLQDELGFEIRCDFTRWTGMSPDKSYVRMRVVLFPDDIIAKRTMDDYADIVLAGAGAGNSFKNTVIDTLTPFMYPDTIGDLYNHPDDIKRLADMGVYQERLFDIVSNAKLNYCREANLFRLYLRPERIITDMLADPKTNKVKGHMDIIGVYGTTSETIRWEVAVTKNKNSFGNINDLNMDAIFDRRS